MTYDELMLKSHRGERSVTLSGPDFLTLIRDCITRKEGFHGESVGTVAGVKIFLHSEPDAVTPWFKPKYAHGQ